MSTPPSRVTPPDVVAGRDYRLLIGGELRDASDGGVRETIDPSTGLVITEVPEATTADVSAAVAAADAAQQSWEGIGLRGRGEVFRALGEVVAEHREELALLDAVDCGNPLSAMRTDVDISLANIRDWPALAFGMRGEVIPASPGNLHYTTYEPYGVVGRIVAFNHPGMFAMTRILAALVVGNTVVLKPGEQTPLSALALGEFANDVVPPGVLNIVSGGAATGDALVTHPEVKRIGFTGSVPTGLKIQQRAATTAVKHVSLELGGKNAMVVFPDVDVVDAVNGAVDGMNLEVCQGQSCGSNSRVFVHQARYDEFVEAIAERVRSITVGPAYSDETDMGPLVSADHLERVMGHVAGGRDSTATLVAGGGRPDGLEAGYYLEPTVFADVDMSMPIARDEIFGPVVTVLPWDDYDEVITQANALDYGLTASVWTSDLHLAHRTAQRLEAGYVWINDSSTHYWGTPFGGVKNSGTGREESTEELRSYLETKSIHTILRNPQEAFDRLQTRRS